MGRERADHKVPSSVPYFRLHCCFLCIGYWCIYVCVLAHSLSGEPRGGLASVFLYLLNSSTRCRRRRGCATMHQQLQLHSTISTEPACNALYCKNALKVGSCTTKQLNLMQCFALVRFTAMFKTVQQCRELIARCSFSCSATLWSRRGWCFAECR